MSLIVNLWGPPSSGKSTQAAGLFYKLKMRSIECELITEKAKDLTWEENYNALKNQLYVSANQLYRQERVEDKVDVIVTDSPILLGLFYNQEKDYKIRNAYENMMLEIFNSKDNLNVWVRRKHKYNNNGRNQTEEQSNDLCDKMLKFFEYHNIPVLTVDGTTKGLDDMFNSVISTLRKDKKI